MKTVCFYYLFFIALILPVSLYATEYEHWTVTNFTNENGLPQNSIKFAEMDNDGYLWLATEAGIVRYDGQRFRVFDNSNSSLVSNRYLKLGKDEEGHIYCIDAGNQIAWYNTQTGFSKPVDMRNLVPGTSREIIDLDRLDLGKLAPFINSMPQPRDANEFAYHPTGKKKGFIVLRHTIVGYMSGGRVRWVDSLRDLSDKIYRSLGNIGDKLCYISQRRDIVLIDSNGVHSRKKIPVEVAWDKLLKQISLVSIFSQEHQLILDLGGDIYEVRLTGNELEFHLLVAAKDILNIHCIRYYPKQGLLLIGSNTRGLFLFKKQQLVTTGTKSRSHNAFYALAPYGSNQLLSSSGILPDFRPVPAINEVLGKHSILYDHNQHYWYSTGSMLLETDDKFHVLKKIPISQYLICIQEDAQGTVWLSLGGNNFGRIQADTFQKYRLDTEGKDITNFIPAGNQTFWLVGTGLCMWLDVKHHRQHIYHEFDSIELRTTYLDKQGNVWLGSYGQGYFLFRDGHFKKMPEDESHYLKVVHSFLEDSKGFIWMTTNRGLFQCAVNDLYKYAQGNVPEVYRQYYGIESGLKTGEFNGGCTPSGLVLSNGRFAFPAMEGIVLFHPDSIKPVLPTGNLFIEQVLLDGVPVNGTGLSKIQPSFKRLELTVSSPYFGNPNNLNIQYNIEGLDDRWYALGENSRIILNRLKYGNYKIRLRKKSGFGAGNYITTELPLVVVPFFYQTWWFRIIVGICIALLVLLIIRVRFKYLIHQRNRLEAEVKDRTSALVYNNKLMEKLTVMIAHDLKSPLHFLSKITGHLRNNVQQENLQEIDRTSSEIKNTADQVYQFIEEFNLWASSFREGFIINKTSFALEGLLQELGLFFREMLAAKGNRLLTITPVNYILDTDRELLKVILRNIIDNANKHGHACDISISVCTETEEHISITIADTGEGMSKPVLKRIQDRIALASTAASIEQNSRLGYQMIIDFATRLEATLDVQSERGKGTSVKLLIPGKISETVFLQSLAEQVVSTG